MLYENQSFQRYESLKQETTTYFTKIHQRYTTKETQSNDLHIFYITSKHETTKIVYDEKYQIITIKNIYSYELEEIALLQNELIKGVKQ